MGLIVTTNFYELPEINVRVFSLIPNFSQNAAKQTIWVNKTNITPTIIGALFIVATLLVGFSKEKNEDEYIARMRLASLLWAVLLNYVLLLVAFLLVFDFGFFTVMLYNMFTVLLLFIFRFHYLLFCSKNAMADEK